MQDEVESKYSSLNDTHCKFIKTRLIRYKKPTTEEKFFYNSGHSLAFVTIIYGLTSFFTESGVGEIEVLNTLILSAITLLVYLGVDLHRRDRLLRFKK